MSETLDELAGVVDLFGALTRAELERALSELAFKQGEASDADALAEAVDRAVAEYYLVDLPPEAVAGVEATGLGVGGDGSGHGDADDPDGGNEETDGSEGVDGTNGGTDEDGEPTLLAAGPAAFPALPPNAEDLPRILDLGERRVDREAAGRRAAERLLADAARAADEGDEDRIERLIDVSYDLEAWAPVDVGDARDRLDNPRN